MQKMSLIGIWILVLLNSCSNEPKNPIIKSDSGESNKKLSISFVVDDSSIALHDDFTLFFITDKDTLAIPTKNNELILPDLKKDTGYSVSFKYKDYTLSFRGITKKMIFPEQDVEWKFGIDNRPFNKLTGLLSDEEYKTDMKTMQLQYLQFNLLEHGDGIQFVNKIPSK